MSSEGDEPEGSGSDYDRMSLNSLNRELEVQKARTAQELEETRERIRESSEAKTPWRMLLIAGGVTLGLCVLVLVILRTTLPDETLRALDLPEFIAPEPDAGPEEEPEPEPEAVDAGPPDAGAQARGRRHRRRGHRGTTPTPNEVLVDEPETETGGGFIDPIEGLTDE